MSNPVSQLDRAKYRGQTFLDDIEGNRRKIGQLQKTALTTASAHKTFAGKNNEKVFDGWSQEDVAANQSAEILYRWGNTAVYLQPLSFPVSGSITKLGVVMSGSRTAGTLTVEVYIYNPVDGLAASGLKVDIDGNSTKYVQEVISGNQVVFAAGDDITLRITTTSGWLPTNIHLQNVFVWVDLDG